MLSVSVGCNTSEDCVSYDVNSVYIGSYRATGRFDSRVRGYKQERMDGKAGKAGRAAAQGGTKSKGSKYKHLK